MKRSAAEKAVNGCRYLTAAEKFVFMVLLTGSDNADCRVPDYRTLSTDQLVEYTRLARSTVFESLRHLEQHGWLIRGKRGRRSSYALVPREPDPSCTCTNESAPPDASD